jgi:hypothetical protein
MHLFSKQLGHSFIVEHHHAVQRSCHTLNGDLEHLALMEKILGPFPRCILKRAKHSPVALEAFDSSGRHRLDRVLSSESASYVRKQAPLESIIREEDGRFLQLLRRILVIDPEERVSAHECVRYCL